MDFFQSLTIICPDNTELKFENAYIYDDGSNATYRGDFLPNEKHTAIIPANECSIKVGSQAVYNDLTRTVTAVCDNTTRSKLMPHIRLTLE